MKQHFLLVLTILFFSPITVSNIVVHKRDLVQRWAYRCDTKIFWPEVILSAAQDLKRRIQTDSTKQSYAPYTSTVDPAFAGIVDGDGFPLMWPLLSPKQSLEKHGHKAVYYVIVGSENYRLLDVIHKQYDGTIVKCVVERDLTQLSNNQITTGFRCPMKVFSFEAIRIAIRSTIMRRAQLDDLNSPRIFPLSFRKNYLFDYYSRLFMSPMLDNGKLNNKALTSVILNDSYDVIGMVHRRQDTFIRCRLTSFSKEEPMFIGILPEVINLTDKIVFKCDEIYVRLESALKIATEAIDGFSAKKLNARKKYPKYISDSLDGGPLELYLWPISFEENKKTSDVHLIYQTHEVFLLINDFSDIVDVIYKDSDRNYNPKLSDFRSCERLIENSLLNSQVR